MRKKLLPTITVIIYMILSSYAHADTYTHEIPMQGCYKNNTSDQCVEVTSIRCVDVYNKGMSREERYTRLQNNVRLYGPVVASMCDDLQYTVDRQVKAESEVIRLRKIIRELKAKK